MVVQTRCRASCSLESAAAHRGGISPYARICLVLFLLTALLPLTVRGNDLVAVTAAGRRVVLLQVEKDVTSVEISCRDTGLTLQDPVVEIQGFAGLENLRELHLYHVPQIVSYDFLAECTSLRRLLISFGRVKNLSFLSSLGQLNLLHLEFCSDWESSIGLPFVTKPIDLSANKALEYIAFRVCDLKRPPVFIHVPETLRFVDLSYNPMTLDKTDQPALEQLKGVERVVLAGASASPTWITDYANVTFDSADSELSAFLSR